MDRQITIRSGDVSFSEKKGARALETARRLRPDAVLVRVNGVLRDLATVLDEDCELEAVGPEDPDALDTLRHSASHLLAHAVLDLFPEAKTGVGPAVENGFYYDFYRETAFTPEDLEAIEKRMQEIVRADEPVERLVMSKAEAVRLFRDKGQDFKVELVEEKGGAEVTCYRQGGFVDFCLGPHVHSTGVIKAFKVLSVSGAYWKGDERNPQMQRIYGTAFFTKQELDDHLAALEEARRRDHRKLGPELDLYSVSDEVGGGLILWHPKGGRLRAIVEQYWREKHWEGGYDILYTPHVGRDVLWQTSGHLGFYKDSMFPAMELEGQSFYIKPMNCPFHIQVYKTRLRSYRDLPLRWAELGTVYRFERSGTLHGLLRVRGFTQDDAHIFCTPDQIESEILRVLDFSISLLADFGFRDNKIELSVRDPKNPAKYCGADDMWCRAEASLVKALEARALPYERIEGEAVFYGPKIDIKVKDALGRFWQCTTIQFDFNLPERFDMKFVGEDGREHRPLMVHRALLGSMERFFGILIEHYKGAFPLWLAPVQAVILPIAERHEAYALSLEEKLRAEGVRVRVDLSREKVNKKIRAAELEKVPLILVVGDREVASGAASLRVHGRGDRGTVEIRDFLAKVRQLIQNKNSDLTF